MNLNHLKKDSLTLPCSYRPISLLPHISKVIVIVIRSSKYFSKLEELVLHLSVLFSNKAFYGFLPFLFE